MGLGGNLIRRSARWARTGYDVGSPEVSSRFMHAVSPEQPSADQCRSCDILIAVVPVRHAQLNGTAGDSMKIDSDRLTKVLNRRSRQLASRLSTGLGSRLRLNGRDYRAEVFFANQLALQPQQSEAYLNPAFEAALALKAGAFLDVGANIGQTLLMLLSLDAQRHYVGFEPQLDCCFYIQRFIEQNRLPRHYILPVGLSNRSGLNELFRRSVPTDTTASTIRGFRSDDFYGQVDWVPVVRGDQVVSELRLSAIGVLKIDVEGGELEVLEGFRDTLDSHRPFVFFEVLNHFMVATGQHLDAETVAFREDRVVKLERLLRDEGFAIFNILPGHALELQRIEPKVSADLSLTNYVAVPKDMTSEFSKTLRGLTDAVTPKLRV